MRTAADSTVARKVDGTIVTFEADELDAAACSGVVGHGDRTRRAGHRSWRGWPGTGRLPLVPWAAGVTGPVRDDHHRAGRGPPRPPPRPPSRAAGLPGAEDREVAGPAPAVQARRFQRRFPEAGRYPVPSSGVGSAARRDPVAAHERGVADLADDLVEMPEGIGDALMTGPRTSTRMLLPTARSWPASRRFSRSKPDAGSRSAPLRPWLGVTLAAMAKREATRFS